MLHTQHMLDSYWLKLVFLAQKIDNVSILAFLSFLSLNDLALASLACLAQAYFVASFC